MGAHLNAYLLLRRVHTGADKFGDVFWAADAVPTDFKAASAALNIKPVTAQDATTQADIATLANFSRLPCPSSPLRKCKACVDGCVGPANMDNATQEQCHYRVPDGSGDVILYRVPTHHYQPPPLPGLLVE